MRYLALLFVLIAISLQTSAQRKHFSPHLISATFQANNTGPGFGLRYEYFLSSDKVSFSVPLQVCFSRVDGKHYVRPGGIDIRGEDQRPAMYFVSPGLNYYPTRSSGVVRYALGINLFVGNGKGASNRVEDATVVLQSRSMTGISCTNGIHFHCSRYVRAGIELSLGICDDDGYSSAAGPGTNPFGQLTFSLGGRL